MLQKFRSKGALNDHHTFLQVILILTMMLFLAMYFKKNVSFGPTVNRNIQKTEITLNHSYPQESRFY